VTRARSERLFLDSAMRHEHLMRLRAASEPTYGFSPVLEGLEASRRRAAAAAVRAARSARDPARFGSGGGDGGRRGGAGGDGGADAAVRDRALLAPGHGADDEFARGAEGGLENVPPQQPPNPAKSDGCDDAALQQPRALLEDGAPTLPLPQRELESAQRYVRRQAAAREKCANDLRTRRDGRAPLVAALAATIPAHIAPPPQPIAPTLRAERCAPSSQQRQPAGSKRSLARTAPVHRMRPPPDAPAPRKPKPAVETAASAEVAVRGPPGDAACTLETVMERLNRIDHAARELAAERDRLEDWILGQEGRRDDHFDGDAEGTPTLEALAAGPPLQLTAHGPM
jgi:hypothetical protein